MTQNIHRNNLISAFIWCAVSGAFLPWHLSAINALMFLRCGIVAACLLLREVPLARPNGFRIWISRAAALIPFGLHYTSGFGGYDQLGLFFVVIGTFIVCLACLDLGKSFGVAPAIRPYVSSGIYSLIPHPMYLGHFIGEAGFLLISPTPRNTLVIVVCWSFYLLRMRWESELISGYLTTPGDSHVGTQLEAV